MKLTLAFVALVTVAVSKPIADDSTIVKLEATTMAIVEETTTFTKLDETSTLYKLEVTTLEKFEETTTIEEKKEEAKEKPIEEKPFEKVDEKLPIEEKPFEKVDEKLPVEKPIEEKPVEVKPIEIVEEKPIEEKPVEVKPIEIVEEKPFEKPIEASTTLAPLPITSTLMVELDKAVEKAPSTPTPAASDVTTEAFNETVVIARRAARDIESEDKKEMDGEEKVMEEVKKVEEVIDDLPTAANETKEGNWTNEQVTLTILETYQRIILVDDGKDNSTMIIKKDDDDDDVKVQTVKSGEDSDTDDDDSTDDEDITTTMEPIDDQ